MYCMQFCSNVCLLLRASLSSSIKICCRDLLIYLCTYVAVLKILPIMLNIVLIYKDLGLSSDYSIKVYSVAL